MQGHEHKRGVRKSSSRRRRKRRRRRRRRWGSKKRKIIELNKEGEKEMCEIRCKK